MLSTGGLDREQERRESNNTWRTPERDKPIRAEDEKTEWHAWLGAPKTTKTHIRIMHSSSRAQDKDDSRNHGL